MNVLSYLEVKIVEHCNFRCRGCAAFSNIASKSEYGIKEYESDIKRISELLDNIYIIRLLGGEPLLSDKIIDYLSITRKYLPNTNIKLVTNGYILHKMDDIFFQCLKDNSIHVDISNYVNKAIKNKQGYYIDFNKLISNNVSFRDRKTRHFEIKLDAQKNNDINVTFKNCRDRIQCNNMFHGKIYPCSTSCSIHHYDAKFNTSFFNSVNGMDIYQENLTGKDILDYLNTPIDFCKNCAEYPSIFRWKEGEARPYD